ncbi:LysR family transcriptional regulator [Albimonas sp. CAU 1670]|uniref:LysR family transcriptional regulator n=1 Tax=Albimonas sp. CAU 1670 TaxID=3032599 RepID=UPI0023DAA9DB|nr:LysR family transcriptional regulator [Albimonas sp. CAU 1670]MDF2232459.1 LysR family transcriptional regulator [Albimonas sp. CAU 1670]
MPDLMTSLSWEDFRLVGAVAETGSLPAAARRLELSHSTVFRRLARIEEAVGAPLFERGREGYVATPAGEEMVAAAEAMAEGAAAFASRIEKREIAPAGDLRIATSDALLQALLTPLLADFRRDYPEVRLELALGNRSLNLSRRDADVAVRATDRPPETLVGRRVAGLGWALYAAVDAPLAAAAGPWVGPSDELADLPSAALTRARAPRGEAAWRVNSVIAMAEAIGQGAGVGYLPCFVGDARLDLRRLGSPEPELAAGLWLLTHPDLRRAPRVRAFLDVVGGRLAGMRGFLSGERPRAGD